MEKHSSGMKRGAALVAKTLFGLVKITMEQK